jgi:hypothetical protein
MERAQRKQIQSLLEEVCKTYNWNRLGAAVGGFLADSIGWRWEFGVGFFFFFLLQNDLGGQKLLIR